MQKTKARGAHLSRFHYQPIHRAHFCAHQWLDGNNPRQLGFVRYIFRLVHYSTCSFSTDDFFVLVAWKNNKKSCQSRYWMLSNEPRGKQISVHNCKWYYFPEPGLLIPVLSILKSSQNELSPCRFSIRFFPSLSMKKGFNILTVAICPRPYGPFSNPFLGHIGRHIVFPICWLSEV